MQRRLLFVSLTSLVLAAVSFGAAATRHIVAIKSKLTIASSASQIPGAVILIEDGTITAVGPAAKVKIPWNAEVIDATGKVVMPGFVLAHTFEGLESANESMPDVPFLSTFDAIDPFQSFFKMALRNGITTILVLPGNNTRFGGTGTIVHPVGKTVEEMLVMKPFGLKISLSPAGGQSRMGHMQKLRQYLREQKKYREDLARRQKEAAAANKPFSEEVPPERKPMQDLLSGKLTAFVYCPTASDAIRAIDLIREFKLRAVLVLGEQTWRAAPHIGKAKLPVILPPDIVFFEQDPVTAEVNQRVLPLIFGTSRVTCAYQIRSRGYEARYPWQVAAEAVKHGVSRKAALGAVTTVPAALIGLGGKIGQIRKGYQADLLLLTGDPLDPKTWIEKVMIGGKVVYDRSKDEFLKELLGAKKK